MAEKGHRERVRDKAIFAENRVRPGPNAEFYRNNLSKNWKGFCASRRSTRIRIS